MSGRKRAGDNKNDTETEGKKSPRSSLDGRTEKEKDADKEDGKLPAKSDNALSITMSKNGEPLSALPQSSHHPLLESKTFDHRRCKNPSDHRYLLRQELVREELLSEETIMEIVRNHPKTCKCRYVFSYPTKRRTVELYPLTRICCLNPSVELVRLVHRAFPEAIAGPDDDDRLPLHYACRFGASKVVVDYLIQQYDNSIRIPTKEGVLPLHYACRNQATEIVHDLISLYPESVKISNNLSWLPLHYACCQHKESHSNMLISYLISLYPDACKARTSSGSLPIHYAAGETSFRAIKTLVSIYPDGVKAANKSQNLPLHHACYKRASIEVINLLVQMYPDSVACRTGKGSTPLQIVSENDSPTEVILYLARVESALDTLISLPFDARCKIMDDMMSEALQETQSRTKSPAENKSNEASSLDTTHLKSELTEDDSDDIVVPNTANATDSSTEQQANASSRSTQATVATSNRTTTSSRILPGAVRIRGLDASETSDDDDDDNFSFTERDAPSAAEELIVASEIAPRVTELEAELEDYRRRFEKEVVPADEVMAVPVETPPVDSKCCIIL